MKKAIEMQDRSAVLSRFDIPSIGEHFAAHNSRTRGFDYLRIGLAVAVLAWHSYGITYGEDSVDTFLGVPVQAAMVYFVVPMFFALSGFLVTTSLYRLDSLRVYLTFRALRLFPALIVEVCLAALVLGPVLTSMSLAGYFSAGQFYGYFLNIAGLVHYVLPGLFAENPLPQVVNGSLWTIPYELECYIYLAIFFVLGFYAKRWKVAAVFAVLTGLVVLMGFTSTKGVVVAIKDMILDPVEVRANLQEAKGPNAIEIARILVSCFFAGSLIYVLRAAIPLHWTLGVLSGVISYVMLLSPDWYLYVPLPISYFTVWLGLMNLPGNRILDSGDYSYGIYLYAFPIQQAVAYSGVTEGNYLAHVTLSLGIVSLFAMFSWHVIEKPSLRLKRHFI